MIAAGVVDAVRQFGESFLDECGQSIEVVDVCSHESMGHLVSDGSIHVRMTVVGIAVDIVVGDGGVVNHGYVECEGIDDAAGVPRVIDGGEGSIGGIVVEADVDGMNGGTAFVE